MYEGTHQTQKLPIHRFAADLSFREMYIKGADRCAMLKHGSAMKYNGHHLV